MKKLFIALIIFLFSVSFVHAVTIASGSVTLANTRLSLVNGTAFVDFSAADVLTDYLGNKLTVIDSAGKRAVGYIKAQGTGETLGDELVTNGDMETGNTSGWSQYGTVSLSSVEDPHAGTYAIQGVSSTNDVGILQNITTIVGASYSISTWLKKSSGAGTILYGISGVVSWAPSPAVGETWTNATKRYTAIGTTTAYKSILIAISGETTWQMDDVTFKQVLTPSATGVTITSTPNGTTYNWTSIESGFNYNDASGYTYTIESVGGGGSLMLLGVGK